jgi:hypothetical protein
MASIVGPSIGVNNLKSLVKQRLVDGFSIHKDTKLEFSKGCVLKK